MTEKVLVVGDIVQLSSSDLPMTVTRTGIDVYEEIECAWIDNTLSLHRERFKPAALVFMAAQKDRDA